MFRVVRFFSTVSVAIFAGILNAEANTNVRPFEFTWKNVGLDSSAQAPANIRLLVRVCVAKKDPSNPPAYCEPLKRSRPVVVQPGAMKDLSKENVHHASVAINDLNEKIKNAAAKTGGDLVRIKVELLQVANESDSGTVKAYYYIPFSNDPNTARLPFAIHLRDSKSGLSSDLEIKFNQN